MIPTRKKLLFSHCYNSLHLIRFCGSHRELTWNSFPSLFEGTGEASKVVSTFFILQKLWVLLKVKVAWLLEHQGQGTSFSPWREEMTQRCHSAGKVPLNASESNSCHEVIPDKNLHSLPCNFSTSISSSVWLHWSQTGRPLLARRPRGCRAPTASGPAPAPCPRSSSWCPPPAKTQTHLRLLPQGSWGTPICSHPGMSHLILSQPFATMVCGSASKSQPGETHSMSYTVLDALSGRK